MSQPGMPRFQQVQLLPRQLQNSTQMQDLCRDPPCQELLGKGAAPSSLSPSVDPIMTIHARM